MNDRPWAALLVTSVHTHSFPQSIEPKLDEITLNLSAIPLVNPYLWALPLRPLGAWTPNQP
jgi:hypothetical protein